MSIAGQKGSYFVTAFGKVIYDAQRLVVTAVKNHWKLKAIDSLKVANDDMVPKEERIKIIELIIGSLSKRERLANTRLVGSSLIQLVQNIRILTYICLSIMYEFANMASIPFSSSVIHLDSFHMWMNSVISFYVV